MSRDTPHGRADLEAAAHQSECQQPVDRASRAMQIAAAQLRLVTDRRLGKATPEWVRQLAAEKTHPDTC